MQVRALVSSSETLRDKFDRHLLTKGTFVPPDEITLQPQLRESVFKEKLLTLQCEWQVPVLNRFPLQLNDARTYAPEYLVAVSVNGNGSGQNQRNPRFVMIEPCCFSMKMSREAIIRKVRQYESVYRHCHEDFHIVLAGTVTKKEVIEYVELRTNLSFGAWDQYWQIPNGNSPRQKVEKVIAYNLETLIGKSDIRDISPALRKTKFMKCLKKYHDLPETTHQKDDSYIATPEDLKRAESALYTYEELSVFRDIPTLRLRIAKTEENDPGTKRNSKDHIWEKYDGGSSNLSNIQHLPRSQHDLKTIFFEIYRRILGRKITKSESMVLNRVFLNVMSKVNGRSPITDSPYALRSLIRDGELTSYSPEEVIGDYDVAASPVLNT